MMTTRSPMAWLIGTHVLALGLGLGVALLSGSKEVTPRPEGRPAPTRGDHAGHTKRLVSTDELLGAYRDRDYNMISEARRSRGGAEETTTSPTPDNNLSPEERAAATEDMSSALHKELDAVNRGKSYDYMFSKALIKRWLLEDPAACMKWVGSMQAQVGWGDPFNALAEALPAEKLLDLMDESWLSRNRRMALESIAETLGSTNPKSLSSVLSKLSGTEASSFRSTAIRNAEPKDADVWLAFALESQPELVSTLANQWLGNGWPSWEWKDNELAVANDHFNKGDWAENARMVLAAAEGTAAEEEIRRRYELAQTGIEEKRLLTLAMREPNNAYDQLMALRQSSGKSAESVRSEVTESITSQFSREADQWQQGEWELALQKSILGEQTTDLAITERFERIRAEIPDTFRAPLQQKALADAFRVDPSAAIRVGMEYGMKDSLIKAANQAISEGWPPHSVRADIMLELDRAGLWEDAKSLHGKFASQANKYFIDDPESAQTWKAQLSLEARKTLNAQAP